MVLILTQENIVNLISMKEAIEAAEDAYRQCGHHPYLEAPENRVYTPGPEKRIWLCANPGATLQAVGSYTMCTARTYATVENPSVRRWAPTPPPTWTIYSAETAEILAVIFGQPMAQVKEGSRPVALGTAAASSAVGIKHLARQNATRLGLLGTGYQARAHLVAMCAIRPIKHVKVYSRSPEHREQFCREWEPVLEIPIEPVNSSKEAVQGVDIVMAATSSSVPVFDGHWLEPGVHVSPIVGSGHRETELGGHNSITRREIDEVTFKRADVVVVNFRDQMIHHQTPSWFHAIEQGAISLDQVKDLADVLVGRVPGRTSDEQITLYHNVIPSGSANVGIAYRLYEAAKRKGVGIEIPLPQRGLEEE